MYGIKINFRRKMITALYGMHTKIDEFKYNEINEEQIVSIAMKLNRPITVRRFADEIIIIIPNKKRFDELLTEFKKFTAEINIDEIYEKYTVKELREIAKKHGVDYRKLKKRELIKKLIQAGAFS